MPLTPAAGAQDMFLERHGVKLGFMSAFIKASAYALQEVPAVNGGGWGSEPRARPVCARPAGCGGQCGRC